MTDSTPVDVDRIDSAALQLVGIVHGGGSRIDVAQLVRRLDRRDLIALAISVAALVDPERPPSELLAWLPAPPEDSPLVAPGWTEAALQKAHSDYGNGDRTDRVKAGEATYRRLWKRRQLSPSQRRTLDAARMPQEMSA